MGNFVKTFKDGKAGLNFGLTTGIPPLDKAINGIQRGVSIGVAAAPKCGKTTLADYAFLISPYLQMLQLGKIMDIEWTYFSFEVDRISKEFKIASFFMHHDFGMFSFDHKGETYNISMDYLMGKQLHTNKDGTTEYIQVKPEHEEPLKVIYETRIVPIFGRYDEFGRKTEQGRMDFITQKDNPTGMEKYLKAKAKIHGKFVTENYMGTDAKGKPEVKERTIGYIPNDPNRWHIVITDHVRKLKRERGFSMKDNIDKWLEYTTELRNDTKDIFVNICHSNRGVSNVERLKVAGEFIYPTADDVKDTGNLAEESTILITMFNPNDEKYNLERHFGIDLKDHPKYRSIHITESRNTESPAHIQTNMYGNVNLFTGLNMM